MQVILIVWSFLVRGTPDRANDREVDALKMVHAFRGNTSQNVHLPGNSVDSVGLGDIGMVITGW